MKLPRFQRSATSNTKKLIDELSVLDLKLADPAVGNRIENFFSKKSVIRNKREQTVRALLTKKAMLINAFVLPAEGEELMAFSHLAFSCFQSEKVPSVKEAWKGKLKLSMHRLRQLINSDQGESIADEYLFLVEEVGDILFADQSEAKKKRRLL